MQPSMSHCGGMQGLSDSQKRECSAFVYIPQYGPGTASLNVAVAASIVLHHYAIWAGYAERERCMEKFVVAERPQRTAPRGEIPLSSNPCITHPSEDLSEVAALQRVVGARSGVPTGGFRGPGAGCLQGGSGGQEWGAYRLPCRESLPCVLKHDWTLTDQ
jgi:hypothetical protein